MTYRHKKEKCAKETREILENVIKGQKAQYSFLEDAEKVDISNPMENISKGIAQVNVIPAGTENHLEKESKKIPAPNASTSEAEGLEEYQPNQKMGDATPELRKVVQRDKKRRNYVNLRDEYEKK